MAINPIGSSSVFTQLSNHIERNSERVASGKQINSAADNAAGLAISNRLGSQVQELSQANRNANDGVSYLQVADSALASITDGLDRIRELSLQAANGTLNRSDRVALNAEASQIRDEITRNVETTSYNGQSVLNNSDSIAIQLGSGAEDQVDVSVQNYNTLLADLEFKDLDISTLAGANKALQQADQLQTSIDQSGADIGAQTNRLESAINTLFNSEKNAEQSRSRIEDADVAKEVSELTANRIREDVTIALRVQANEESKGVLRLLGE